MKDYTIDGMILGLTSFGATHIKTVDNKIYIEIKEKTELTDIELQRASKAFKHFGYTLMVKKPQ